MSESHFDQAFNILMVHEGGFADLPDDHGGPTNRGITMHTLAIARGCPVTVEDVRNLTAGETAEIYRKNYWEPYGLDRIQSPLVSIPLFDLGVLMGPPTVWRLMQQTLGQHIDGIPGRQTIRALHLEEPRQLAGRFLDFCQAHFREIVAKDPSQAKFLKGWDNRIGSLRGFIALSQ